MKTVSDLMDDDQFMEKVIDAMQFEIPCDHVSSKQYRLAAKAAMRVVEKELKLNETPKWGNLP